MVKNVEPLVTNSDSEERVVRSVAIFLIGGIALAGIVVGLRSCERNFDNRMNQNIGDATYEQLTGFERPSNDNNERNDSSVLSIDHPFFDFNEPKQVD
jgi:hypothetical protein